MRKEHCGGDRDTVKPDWDQRPFQRPSIRTWVGAEEIKPREEPWSGENRLCATLSALHLATAPTSKAVVTARHSFRRSVPMTVSVHL